MSNEFPRIIVKGAKLADVPYPNFMGVSSDYVKANIRGHLVTSAAVKLVDTDESSNGTNGLFLLHPAARDANGDVATVTDVIDHTALQYPAFKMSIRYTADNNAPGKLKFNVAYYTRSEGIAGVGGAGKTDTFTLDITSAKVELYFFFSTQKADTIVILFGAVVSPQYNVLMLNGGTADNPYPEKNIHVTWNSTSTDYQVQIEGIDASQADRYNELISLTDKI
jgi:hypothetical protein